MTDITDVSKNYRGENHWIKAYSLEAETLNVDVVKVDWTTVKMPALSWEATTAWGAAAEDITVTGALTSDIVLVTLADNGTNDVTILTAIISAANTLTVTFSADPGDDSIVSYLILR